MSLTDEHGSQVFGSTLYATEETDAPTGRAIGLDMTDEMLELAASPGSAFVADFTGAVVLTGTARGIAGQLTIVDLDGGGVASSTDTGAGRVALSVYPWEITLSHANTSPDESAQNRLNATITSITTVGNRVRVGLTAGQPLVAEVTGKATEDLELAVGGPVTATWKATATRLVVL